MAGNASIPCLNSSRDDRRISSGTSSRNLNITMCLNMRKDKMSKIEYKIIVIFVLSGFVNHTNSTSLLMSSEEKKTLKLILVGSGGVGKTSLVTKFYNQQFESQTLPTVAPAFCVANIPLKDGVVVELQIWDTAGQEQYQSICQMFYHDSNIAFVCFDLNTIDTVESWVSRVKSQVPSCLIFLVSTKIDLLTNDKLTQLKKDGKEMMEKYGAEAHYLTSSQTGQGVSSLFMETASYINKIESYAKPEIQKLEGDEQKKSCCQ